MARCLARTLRPLPAALLLLLTTPVRADVFVPPVPPEPSTAQRPSPPPGPGAAAAAQQARVLEMTGADAVAVAFVPGSAALTPEARTQLAALAVKAQVTGHVEQVLVGAWADHGAPAEGQTLPPEQRTLAEQRGDAVRQQLLRDGARNVAVHSFADAASWTARDSDTQRLGRQLRERGGPGKAVVLLKPDAGLATP